MIIIANFNVSKKLADVKYDYDNNYSSIDSILDDFTGGTTSWSVSRNTVPGDIVVFMCAKEARHNLGMATSHIPASYGQSFVNWVNNQKATYQKYSGCILGYGVVSSYPTQDPYSNYWMADIKQLKQFIIPIHIDEFRSFITIARTNSITKIDDEQWERLKWVVNLKNPGMFSNVTAPDIKTIEGEFDDAVKKEGTKPLNKLEKDAKKKASRPVASVVTTKTYHRDPTIAAYVKKRANGNCQLCGQKAPFTDTDGEPYLECHHIKWLSHGGMDSADNCVALCPNCHRKMHVVNDPNDIKVLETAIAEN